jgi:hypothetical protein
MLDKQKWGGMVAGYTGNLPRHRTVTESLLLLSPAREGRERRRSALVEWGSEGECCGREKKDGAREWLKQRVRRCSTGVEHGSQATRSRM